jgi:leader peptidase (prepilin peptidase)/N-methyltransferase
MLVGLLLSACFPWPWPNTTVDLAQAQRRPGEWAVPNFVPVLGWQPWPFWTPRAVWLPAPGSWQLGLLTGLAGVLAGIVILRAVRFLFGLGRGMEGLGLGDADLMMMAGAFVGWQIVVIGFFVSVFPALILGVGKIILYGDQQLPFGPSLALGVMITLFAWPALGPHFAMVFFDKTLLIVLGIAGAGFLLLASLLLRGMFGTPVDKGEPSS